MTLGNICKKIEDCRICGNKSFETVIDLGDQYIASVFVGETIPKQLKQKFPTEVVRCVDGCGLVQLRHSIEPNMLYADGYGYKSGLNEMMRQNLNSITASIESIVDLKPGDIVLDIGCNDGTLLDSYKTEGLVKVGFDPVRIIAEIARSKGIFVINDYFSGHLFGNAFPNRKAKAVTSIAMFYDLEHPMKFVKEIAALLIEDGVWVIELSYLPSMLENTAFDSICHEHLEYYALRQIEWMVNKEGLAVHRVEKNNVNGGSFRVFICKKSMPWHMIDRKTVESMRSQEIDLHLDTNDPYRAFCRDTLTIKEDLNRVIKRIKKEGKKVFVYGASTKGNTILQYCGINHKLISKAADRNPEKWGLRTLGTDIPIISEEQARSESPDYFLVLPWHFFKGFIKREEEFLKRGGKFILPLPKVQIIGAEDC